MAPILEDIDAFAGPRRRSEAAGEIRIAPFRRNCAAAGAGCFHARFNPAPVSVCSGFDERRLTDWRLEHKLLQAHVFRHFAPNSMPETCGFDRLTYGLGAGDSRTLRERFPGGYVIKSALGDRSGEEIDSRTEAALAWLEAGQRFAPGVGRLTDEEFIVQERKNIRREYRVHTIEDRVIEHLTVHRHHGSVAPESGEAQRLRPADSRRSARRDHSSAELGWDARLLDHGSLSAIEINVGGSTIGNSGFHSSGFFITGITERFIQHACALSGASYQCRIAVVADAPDYPDEQYFYSEVADWKQRS